MAVPFAKATLVNGLFLFLTNVILTELSYFKYFPKEELVGKYDIRYLTINVYKILSCTILCLMLFFENSFRFCEFLVISLFVPICCHCWSEFDKRKIYRINKLSHLSQLSQIINADCYHKFSAIGAAMAFYLIGEPRQSRSILLILIIWSTVSLHNILLVFSSAKTKVMVDLNYDGDYYNNRHIQVSTIEALKLIIVPLIFITLLSDVVNVYSNSDINWKVWVLYMTSMMVNIAFKTFGLFDYYESSKSAFQRIKKRYISKTI